VRSIIVILAGLVLAGQEGLWCVSAADGRKAGARATAVSHGPPPQKVVATGTVEPEELVDVSVQVAGRIASLGADPHDKGKRIDYGSPVEPGTVLAEIDNALYAVRVEQEQAGCQRAEAEITKATIALEHAAVQWQHAQEQKKNQAISDADLDKARFNHKLAEASLTAARAALHENKAALKRAEIELGYTTLKSPVKGVVVDRHASVGQMVGPVVNAPSLFLIARIDRLEVWASVNEADITRIRRGQPVRFTVNAFPGKVFEGTVKQIRLNAQMTQNVVTYTVVVAVTSPTDKLLPYLTAHLEFQ